MRPISIIILYLFLTFSSFAQKTTVISGKVSNFPNNTIIVWIPNNNHESLMENWGLGSNVNNSHSISTTIKEDSTFILTTDLITRPNTSCYLILDDKSTIIFLSPGDSIHVIFSYWSILTSSQFTGNGSGKNLYRQEYNSKFPFNRITKDYIRELGNSILKKLTFLRIEKENLLNKYYHNGLVDTSFYKYEKKRIKYEYFIDVLNPVVARNVKDNKIIDEIKNISSEIDLRDEKAILLYSEYRDLIRYYFYFHMGSPRNPKVYSLIDLIDNAHQKLSGFVNSYYVYYTVWDALFNPDLGTKIWERKIITDYLLENYKEPGIQKLALKYKENRSYYRGFSAWNMFYQVFFVSMVILGFIFLIIFGFIKYREYLNKRNKIINIATWLKYLVLFASLSLTAYFLFHTRNQNLFWPYLTIVLVFLFLIVQIKWLIPRFALQKKYTQYTLILIGTLSSFTLILYKLGVSEIITQQYNYYQEYASLRIFLISGYSLVLISFLYYYINSLAKENKSIGSLFTGNQINRELLINIIIMSILYYSIVLNISEDIQFKAFYIFLIGFSIFYLHAFKLIPQYLFRKFYWRYLQYTILYLLLAFIMIVLFERGVSFGNIRFLGIDLSPLRIISFPINIEFSSIFASQLMIIPAIIYAYTRKRIINNKKSGFALYRKTQAELQQLKAQVNPHFLFNNLNTLYAFALKEKNEKTAESIAKLANLMRFLIDDMDKEAIPIRHEADYILDYIKLQSIRSAVEHNIDIDIQIDKNSDSMISPMLFIPFVENAFKHGMNPNEVSELKLSLKIDENQIQFNIENSNKQDFEAYYKEKGFGIGIENVRKRLELTYPNKHKLSINETKEKFIVKLSIQIDNSQNV